MSRYLQLYAMAERANDENAPPPNNLEEDEEEEDGQPATSDDDSESSESDTDWGLVYASKLRGLDRMASSIARLRQQVVGWQERDNLVRATRAALSACAARIRELLRREPGDLSHGEVAACREELRRLRQQLDDLYNS